MKMAGEFWGDFHKEFGWLFWGLIALGILWFFMGGPSKETARGGAYIKPPAPLDSGRVYGNYYEGTPSVQKQKLDLPEAPANLIRFIEAPIRKLLND